jgi:hypothetical protein
MTDLSASLQEVLKGKPLYVRSLKPRSLKPRTRNRDSWREDASLYDELQRQQALRKARLTRLYG